MRAPNSPAISARNGTSSRDTSKREGAMVVISTMVVEPPLSNCTRREKGTRPQPLPGELYLPHSIDGVGVRRGKAVTV